MYTIFALSLSQTPLQEVDYSVKNLAVDLKDGLRLTYDHTHIHTVTDNHTGLHSPHSRLFEILTGKWGISEQLRVPATTKMQVH